ncbi:MAG: M13 family metallopeptidase [Microbacteriaceae bacterium]|uniref:M13 family metallopeptidase n=1 Tax=unclassified Microbacterium TaxID=2609290 RepID=UPI00097F2045|nr:M13-type metalloendopeptidase [Microbacterium sp. JB110]RCS60903.1 peptidase M13 [Microbacterium sp. JB110]SJM64152.1 Metallopeptidase [Frigoribacterium sp. JB110]
MALPSGIAVDELNPDIRAQDDLFRHVNGSWIERTEIPDDKARWGSFHALAERAEADVRAIVEEMREAEPGSQARKIGDLYSSFMDVDRINALGAEPLRSRFAAIDELADIPSFLRFVGELDREGVASVFGLYVEPDPGDPERAVPFVAQAGLSLPDEQYYREEQFAEVREAFRAHVERMLALAGIDAAADQADRLVALETELAGHHWDNVASRDAVATYNLKTWAEVQELAGADLEPWRDAVVPDAAAFAEIVVNQPSFVTGLGSMLVEERLDDWKAWLRYAVVRGAAAYLTDEFVNENFGFYGTALTGVPQIRERWKRGVGFVEGAMGEAVGRIYVERHFPPQAKAEIDTLVKNLVEAYRQSITELDWMSPETRERALEKLDQFTPKIGHPDVWRDFSALAVDAGDLVGNAAAAGRFEHDRQMRKIGQPIDRDEWLMSPQTVNAYYHPLQNEVVFPAAILQYPFFDVERDPAANYGGIGAVIGHEIGHGFDDQGSQYDGTGALRNWWTEADREAFEKRTASLIAQFDSLTPVGLEAETHHVNGALTIGENIGDLGGLGIALKAYSIAVEKGEAGEPGEIDGLDGLKRVFLSWAQVWQQKSRDAEAIRLLAIDPHSPNEFRCNQIVRNIDAFYDAFGVVEGDALWLPEVDRVTIW